MFLVRYFSGFMTVKNSLRNQLANSLLNGEAR